MPAAPSPAQQAASRANGARSRGPVTPAGKARAEADLRLSQECTSEPDGPLLAPPRKCTNEFAPRTPDPDGRVVPPPKCTNDFSARTREPEAPTAGAAQLAADRFQAAGGPGA